MKKLLLTTFVLLIFNSLKAQIPNGGFECWVPHAGPPAYEEPCGWTSLDSSSFVGYPIFVTKSTDSHSDTFSIQVATIGYINPYPPFNFVTDIGLARTGNDYQNGVTGFRDTVRHTSFSAWVKYLRQGPDSAEVKIKLYKWDINLHQPVDVATAKFYVSYADTLWHYRTASFVYVAPFTLSGNPDTACVYISSTRDTVWENIIRVDDISYIGSVPVVEVQSEVLPKFYPNPADDHISFELPRNADRIKIYQITGEMVAAEAVRGRSALSVDLKQLDTGVYLYGVYDENNKMVSSGKFSIVR